MIARQVTINVCLLKSLILQHKSLAGLERVKTMFNWALVLRVSKAITKHKRSKNTLSYSDILSVKNLGGISTLLLDFLIAQYKFYFDQDGLAKPAVSLIQGRIEDGEIITEGKKFVIQLLLIMIKTAKIIV